MAGVVPGIVLCFGMLVISWWATRKIEYAWEVEPFRIGEFVRQTVKTLPILLLPIVILGGIVSGMFTVTESAAIGVVYSLVIGFFMKRELKLADIVPACVYSAGISAVAGMLIAVGSIASWIMTRNGATAQIGEWAALFSHSDLLFMSVVLAVLLVLGCFMSGTPIIIALAPILAPVAVTMGISDFQFGILFVLALDVGLLTPPVGLLIFLTSSIAGISPERLSIALIPFVIWSILCCVLIVVFPELTDWFPRLLGYS
jgi:tripartite ATP-independent transporter DctM subunit